MKRIFMWAPLFILPLSSSVGMAISKPAPGSAAPAPVGDPAGIPSVYLWVAGVLVILLAVWLWRGRAGGPR